MTVKVEGAQVTARKLLSLGDKVAKKVVGKAANAGGRPLLKAVRRSAPRRNGLLAKSLDMKVKRYGAGAAAVVGQIKSDKHRGRVIQRMLKKDVDIRSGGISGRGDFVPLHMVENQVKAHGIRPRNNQRVYGERGALVFWTGGRFVAVRGVQHPGHPGRQFVRSSTEQTTPEAFTAAENKLTVEVNAEADKAAASL